MLGLGADAVLMGRPFVIASFGGGLDGVEFFIEKVRSELCETMILTACQNVKDIDGRVIWK